MYRVSLMTNDRLVVNKWIEADSVREGTSGATWEFLDADGFVLRRLRKASVRSFEVVEDRRKVIPFDRKPDPSRLGLARDFPQHSSDSQPDELFRKTSKAAGRTPAPKPGQPPAR